MKKLFLALILGLSLTASPSFSANEPDYKAEAVACIKRQDSQGAIQIANKWLEAKASEKKPLEKRDGDAIHDANQILGAAALQEKRIDDAKKYLLAAGATPGSTTLCLFGPNMVLAQKLLSKGETQVVLDYLALVEKFWAHVPPHIRKDLEKKNPELLNNMEYMNQENQDTINKFVAQIRKGYKPILNHSSQF